MPWGVVLFVGEDEGPLPRSGIFLQQQSLVSYCCLFSQIPVLFQGHSPPPPSSAQAGCEATCPVTFHFQEGHAASHLHLPSSLLFSLEKTQKT